MTTPTKPFVGMAPALYWSAGGNTYEVDDPRFYQWINTPGTVVRLWLSDPLSKTTTVTYDGGESGQSARYVDSYPNFSPGRVFGRGESIVVDGPVWLAISTPDAGLTMTSNPQQTNMTPYDYGGSTYFMLVLSPDGRANPYWQQLQDDSQSWGEFFVEAATVVWGGAFAVAAVAGAATVSTAVPAAAAGESVVSAASTTAGGGELIASDFVGPVATGGTAAGGSVAASATAGTTAAATGNAAFSMADVMGASKAVVAVAGAATKIEQAISGATVARVPPAPESAPPKPPDNSWLALLGVAVILVLPP